MAVGYWLLAIGCWLLAVGCWLLAVGYWLLAIGYWLLAVGCWLGFQFQTTDYTDFTEGERGKFVPQIALMNADKTKGDKSAGADA